MDTPAVNPVGVCPDCNCVVERHPGTKTQESYLVMHAPGGKRAKIGEFPCPSSGSRNAKSKKIKYYSTEVCKEEGCVKTVQAKHLCSTHYSRQHKAAQYDKRKIVEAQLRAELTRIEEQRHQIIEEAKRRGLQPRDIYKMKDSEGNFVMLPIILARSNILLALSNIKKH